MIDSDWERIIEFAIADTTQAFLSNPNQFHGDTGIMHYLYHRVMVHGGDKCYRQTPAGCTLLFQSEYYTQLEYKGSGGSDRLRRKTCGRFDFAVIDPASLDQNGRINRHASAAIAIEVSRNKSFSKMGDVHAGREDSSACPGDAAKLIRELRFAGLRRGYLLEFYSRKNLHRAQDCLSRLNSSLQDASSSNLFVLAAVQGQGQSHYVSTVPQAWKPSLGLSFPDFPSASAPPQRSSPGLLTGDLRVVCSVDGIPFCAQNGGKGSRGFVVSNEHNEAVFVGWAALKKYYRAAKDEYKASFEGPAGRESLSSFLASYRLRPPSRLL